MRQGSNPYSLAHSGGPSVEALDFFGLPKNHTKKCRFCFGGEDGDSVCRWKSSTLGSMCIFLRFFFWGSSQLGSQFQQTAELSTLEVLFHTQQGLQAGTTYGFMVSWNLIKNSGFRKQEICGKDLGCIVQIWASQFSGQTFFWAKTKTLWNSTRQSLVGDVFFWIG